jgi:hypothetical protein
MAAVIDSAAEVTILSDKIYNSLQDRPQILIRTRMYAAGSGMQMDTMIVGPGPKSISSSMGATYASVQELLEPTSSITGPTMIVCSCIPLPAAYITVFLKIGGRSCNEL